LIISADMG